MREDTMLRATGELCTYTYKARAVTKPNDKHQSTELQLPSSAFLKLINNAQGANAASPPWERLSPAINNRVGGIRKRYREDASKE